MKRLLIAFFLFIVYNSFSQEFQLAPPMLKYNSVFFSDSAAFSVIFNQPGTAVYYTLNGNEPTENDLMYKAPVTISKRTIVKVKTIGKGYLPSETIRAEFIKNGKPVKSVQYSTPNESYANAKAGILNDDIGGIPNYRGGTWIGYDRDTVEINIELKKNEKINTVLIDLLQDENSWIFLPEQVLVNYYDKGRNAYVPFGKEVFVNEGPSPKQCSAREITAKTPVTTNKLHLVLYTVRKIPEWHIAKGNHAWLFIDEIKVY
jgi:Fn3 domain-containing protein